MTINMRKHEFIGLLLIFAGASWLGFGVYATLLAANRLIANVPLIKGAELLIFPIFYGIAAVLFLLGKVELREALPGKGRK